MQFVDIIIIPFLITPIAYHQKKNTETPLILKQIYIETSEPSLEAVLNPEAVAQW